MSGEKRLNILLINPPNPKHFVVDRDAAGGFGTLRPKGRSVFPPLSLLYSAAVLEREHFSVALLDCNTLELMGARAVENCKTRNLDVVVILTCTQTFHQDCNFARQIRRETGVLNVIMIGPVIRFFQNETLRCADFGILGEPENVLLSLVNSIYYHKNPASVDGIIFLKDGKLISTGNPLPIQNLDSLPYPAWHLLPRPNKYTFTISSSRGCPYGCFYCPYIVSQGRQYRCRKPENVVDEMQYLVECFDAKSIQFRDPIFTLLRERVEDICNLIIKRKLHVSWAAETRPEHLDFELLELMAKAGCGKILFGVESGSKKILGAIGRLRNSFSPETYLAHVKKIVRKAVKLGVIPLPLFMLGLPDEDLSAMNETINFAKELKVDVHFSIASPYLGTELRELAMKECLIVDDDFSRMDTYSHASMRTRYLSAQKVEELAKLANYEVWAQKGLDMVSSTNLRGLFNHLLNFLSSPEKTDFLKKDFFTLKELLRKNITRT